MSLGFVQLATFQPENFLNMHISISILHLGKQEIFSHFRTHSSRQEALGGGHGVGLLVEEQGLRRVLREGGMEGTFDSWTLRALASGLRIYHVAEKRQVATGSRFVT